jgi:heat shock protein HslJ
MHITTARGTRRVLSLGLAIPVLVAVLAACSTGGGATQAPSASAAASSSASAGPLALDGSTWLLTDYVSPDGTVFTVPAAVTPQLAFEGGNITGNAGCNTFSRTYTVTGDTIEIGPLMSTKMACEEPMASVEAAYLGALDTVNKVAILDDGKLQLWDDGGKTTLAFLKGS